MFSVYTPEVNNLRVYITRPNSDFEMQALHMHIGFTRCDWILIAVAYSSSILLVVTLTRIMTMTTIVTTIVWSRVVRDTHAGGCEWIGVLSISVHDDDDGEGCWM